jgi:hypothetical protein
MYTYVTQFKHTAASVGFLLGFLFDPEYGGDIFLPDFRISTQYMELQPKKNTFFIAKTDVSIYTLCTAYYFDA